MADEWVAPHPDESQSPDISVSLIDDPLLVRITSQAPWWLVSVVFHILLIVLAYMCSIAVSFDNDGETLMNVVTIPPPGFLPEKVEQKKPDLTSAETLRTKYDVPATDKTSKETSPIVVSKELLASVDLSEKFQTENPDRPDTKGAYGNPDSKIFNSRSGDAGDVGGGNGATVLEDMLTAGVGANKRWGAGDGLGVGDKRGPGKATWGRETEGGRKAAVKKYQGSPQTEEAVHVALRWLAYHQESDGHWDAKKYGSSEKTDTAVTSLALLCFLGAGNSEKVGDYKDNIKRGIAWLKSKQSASGLIFDTTDAGGHRGEGYPGAMATMAIAEAAAMANIPETREAAQRAVNYCTEVHQAGDGSDKLAWRYHPKMEGDTSVTGWFMMALKSAKIAGLNVNHAAFDGAIKYLDSVEHKSAAGDPGYAPASTYWYTTKDAHEPHRLTAIGCLCRQYLGWKKEDLQASVDGFVAKGGVPTWGGNGGGVDLYYWYYGTLCTFQQGGDTWKRWNDGLKSALVPNQRKDGDETGSWDPVGAYSAEWGRVGETALACLNLEVYYRYRMLSGEKN